jgi:hypothetical protein
MHTHRIEKPLPGAQPAYLANGLVGLRVPQIPLPRGTALVNGFVGQAPETGHEEYAPAPYPVGADLALGDAGLSGGWPYGTWLSDQPHLATFVSQECDFACGELRSVFRFAAAGATATVEVLTLCSRTQPTLVLQEIAVTVDRPCKLTLQAHIDQRGLPGSLGDRCMPGKHADGILCWVGRNGLSSVGVAYASEFVGEDLDRRRRNDYGHEQDMELTDYSVAARPGKRYVMRQIGSLVPGLMHGEPHWQASRHVGLASWHGFDKLRADNRAAWAELWKGCPKIVGADRKWQDCVEAAYFYLHSSVSPASPCSVAPFGLSRHKEYGGHVFWDTETFMFPAALLTAPETARAMLDYRSRCLPAARDSARLNGYRGVQFPWQSGNQGWEVTRYASGAGGGIGEIHISLDIAFAFAQYVHATGDDLFFRQQAWPVLEGVAEWIVSRVTRTARGYEIRHTTGTDEGIDNIHNNAYTNLAAIQVLREAMGFARRLGVEPPAAWREVAERMFIPVDAKTGVILKHDAYEYKGGMCVPETLAAFFPFGCSHSPAADAATVDYHLKLAHTYLGMPMLSALMGVFAARAGNRKLALEFFDQGVRSHLQEPFRQFNETACAFDGPFSHNGHTVFLTNPAGCLMSLLYGLTGLQLDGGDPQGWAKHPIVLPEGWEAIEVERIWVRGEPYRLTARQGDQKAKLEKYT